MSKDKVIIKGVAVREGTSRNRRKYIAKELLKFAPTLIGRPILKDHEGITDNVIGKITEAFSNDEGKTVEYVGWVKEDGTGLLEKFKDGRISEVSIGAIAGKIVKEKKDDDIIIPIDMEALELSTTPVPGNKGTSITMENNNYTKEKIKEIIKEFTVTNDTFNKNRKEDNKMTNENDNVNENMKLEIQNLKEKLEATNKVNEGLEKEKASLEEQRRLDAIEKYKGICEAKKVEAKDMTKSNMEMINFATEMVDGLPEPKEEESDEGDKPAEEDKSKKKEAESESEEPKSGDEDKDDSKESFDGYVISESDVVGGVALFKTY